MSNQREQQLLMRTLQQEEELRRLRREMDMMKQQQQLAAGGSSAGRRPQTAGAADRGPHSAHAAIPSTTTPTPPTEKIYKTFNVHLVPQGRGHAPHPTEKHTAIPHEGKVTVFGGTSGPYISGDLWEFNVSTSRWRRPKADGTNAPSARYGHSAVQYQGRMFIFGGFGPGGLAAASETSSAAAVGGGASDWKRPGLLDTIYSYDLRKGEWALVKPAHGSAPVEPVKNHSAVVHHGRMYVFGGCLLEGRTNQINVFDLEGNKWLSPEPFNTQAIAVGAQRGGVSGSGKNAAAAIANADVPPPRSGHSTNVSVRHGQGSMIVFGGRLGKYVFCNDVFQYDFESHTWMRLYCGGAIPAPRSDHTANLYKENLVVLGGYQLASGGTKHYLSDCHVLNTVSCTWTKVELIGPQRPLGLCGHSSILFESSDAQICLMMIQGWGLTEPQSETIATSGKPSAAGGHMEDIEESEPGAPKTLPTSNCSTLDDVWTITVAPAPPPSQRQTKEAAAAAQRPRPPSTARGRPSTAGASRLRNRSASPRNEATGGRKAWSTTTCIASTGKLFGEPPHTPKPPCLRSEYQVDSIVGRLYDTRAKEENLAKLRAAYIKEQEPTSLSAEEQSDSVDRLYYQQCEWQQERKRQLEEKWLPRKETHSIDDDTLHDMVSRLNVAPEKKEEPLPPSTTQSRETTETCVQRLHDYALEFKKKRAEELENKYVWGASPRSVRQQQLQAMVDRLTPSPRRK